MARQDSCPESRKNSRIFLTGLVCRNWRCIKKDAVFFTDSLFEWLKKVPDPRSARKKMHVCAEILTYIMMAYLVGRSSLRRAIRWAENNIDYLRQYMKLEHGIASPSTVHRLLRDIDQSEFNNVFMQWIRQIIGNRPLVLAIDGKALRGATDRISDGRPPYILNVIDVTTKLVIAQFPIADKANEISEIPKLLGILDLNRNLITIDAIGTQCRIMDIIEAEGGFYLLTVKENQPGLLEDIKGYFRTVKGKIDRCKTEEERKEITSEEKYSCCQTKEKNRSRIEHRRMEVIQDNPITSREELAFDDIKTIGLHEQVRIPIARDKDGNDITPDYETFRRQAIARIAENKKNKAPTKYEDEYLCEGMISNKAMTAGEMAAVKRDHWTVENSLHHVLDDLFREDRSNARVIKDNLALIRKFDFDLLHIAIRYEHPDYGPTEMLDAFADDKELLAKYFFSTMRGYN